MAKHIGALPEGATLAELNFVNPSEGLHIAATFRAHRAITPAEVKQLQRALREELQDDLRLTVHTTLQASATADEYVGSDLEHPSPAS
jgi:tRNA C32,U32 (ribose-2'-O)-methylase TrmJ